MVTLREALSRWLSSLFFWQSQGNEKRIKRGQHPLPLPCLRTSKGARKEVLFRLRRGTADQIELPFNADCTRAFNRLNESIGAEWTAADIDSFVAHFRMDATGYQRSFVDKGPCHQILPRIRGSVCGNVPSRTAEERRECERLGEECADLVQERLRRDFVVGLTERFDESMVLAAHVLGWRLDSMQYGRVHQRHKVEHGASDGDEADQAAQPVQRPARSVAQQRERAANLLPPALDELSPEALARIREYQHAEVLVYERALKVFEEQWAAAGSAAAMQVRRDEYRRVMDEWDACEQLGTREQRVNTQSGRKGCPEGACTLGLGCVCEPDLNDVDSLDAADEDEHQ